MASESSSCIEQKYLQELVEDPSCTKHDPIYNFLTRDETIIEGCADEDRDFL